MVKDLTQLIHRKNEQGRGRAVAIEKREHLDFIFFEPRREANALLAWCNFREKRDPQSKGKNTHVHGKCFFNGRRS